MASMRGLTGQPKASPLEFHPWQEYEKAFSGVDEGDGLISRETLGKVPRGVEGFGLRTADDHL